MTRMITKTCVYLTLLLMLTGCFHIQLLGSVFGGTITITRLDGSGDSIVFGPSVDDQFWINSLGETGWLDLATLIRLAFVGMAFLPPEADIDPDAYYLVEASGGFDNDPNLKMDLTDDAVPVAGKWHALVKGQRILDGNLKVSILTEALYQSLKADLASMTTMEIMDKLDELAAMVISEDIADKPGVDYEDDIMRWNSSLNRGAYTGAESDLNALANAIINGDDEATIQTLAAAVIGADTPNQFGLNGTWTGRSVEGASGFDASYTITIADNMITSIDINASPTGVTAALSSGGVLLYPGTVFNLNFSDGRTGHLMPATTGRHLVLADSNMVMAVLELDGGARPGYNLSDLQGSFTGGGILATGALGLGGTANCVSDPAGVRCDGVSSIGFAYAIAASGNNGVFQTTAFKDDGSTKSNPAWLVLSNDAQVLGIFYCDDGYTTGPVGCSGGYGPFAR